MPAPNVEYPIVINWEGNNILPADRRFVALDTNVLDVLTPIPDGAYITEGMALILNYLGKEYTTKLGYVTMLTAQELKDLDSDTDDWKQIRNEQNKREKDMEVPLDELDVYIAALTKKALEKRPR